ncbi:MAG: SCO family protein [Myxococcota bacterium]
MISLAVMAFAAALGAPPSQAEERPGRAEPLPKELQGVEITEKLGANVLTGLAFTDSEGKSVTLGDYFKSGKPVILTMNYSDCPMLCSLQLNQFVKTLREMRWSVGDEFEILTVSLDPNEKPDRAAATKARYVKDYGRESAAAGWHFLVGSDDNVHALANSVGFGYAYSETRKEYLHVAAMMLLTPAGVVSRYMYGLQHSPETLRLSLVEATSGKSGSTLDKVILYCFHYDATAGSYVMVANNVMRIGGAGFVLFFAAFLGALWLRERRKRSKRGAADASPGIKVPHEVRQ